MHFLIGSQLFVRYRVAYVLNKAYTAYVLGMEGVAGMGIV